MSESNSPRTHANQQAQDEPLDPVDPTGECLIADEDSDVGEPRPFALEELVLGLHSNEHSGDPVVWCSGSSRLRVEFSRLQVADKDLDTWCHGKVIALDDMSDAPISVYRDEILIARGELVSENNTIGVRITEAFDNDAHKAI